MIEGYKNRWWWSNDHYCVSYGRHSIKIWGLSRNPGLPWSEELIARYVDRWDWNAMSQNEGIPWTMDLIDRYEDRWSWSKLSRNEGLPWSEELIDRYAERWDFEAMSMNSVVAPNRKQLRKYIDRWSIDSFYRHIGEHTHEVFSDVITAQNIQLILETK